MKKKEDYKGITLIALIITIIVLLILSVVSIRTIQGDGILGQARKARDEYSRAETEENTKLSEYEALIAEQTGVSTQNIWIQNGVGNAKITFEKGEDVVALGDIVNYTVNGYNGQWRVLGVDDGQLIIVSSLIKNKSITLRGLEGYYTGQAMLNSACAQYKNDKYATEARSLKVEDINRITGFNPETETETYGDRYIYRRDGDVIIYKLNGVLQDSSDNIVTDGPGDFYLPNGSRLGNNESEEFVNEYYSYNIGNKNSILGNIFQDDWCELASPFVSANSLAIVYSNRYISDGSVKGEGTLWFSGTSNSENSYEPNFRAVVKIKNDIKLEKGSTNADGTVNWLLPE